MSDVTTYIVPQDYVERLWPLAEAYLKEAASHGPTTLEDYKDGVLSGDKQLWLTCEEHGFGKCLAATVTEIVNSDCVIWACGGIQMKRWLHDIDIIEAWAKHMGCKGTYIYGRRGWARALRSHSYKERLVVLHKELAI